MRWRSGTTLVNKSVLHVALIGLLLLATGAAGKSIEDRKWIRLESENFTIHSTFSRSRTRDLLKRLEIVHAMFFGIANEASGQLLNPNLYIKAVLGN